MACFTIQMTVEHELPHVLDEFLNALISGDVDLVGDHRQGHRVGDDLGILRSNGLGRQLDELDGERVGLELFNDTIQNRTELRLSTLLALDAGGQDGSFKIRLRRALTLDQWQRDVPSGDGDPHAQQRSWKGDLRVRRLDGAPRPRSGRQDLGRGDGQRNGETQLLWLGLVGVGECWAGGILAMGKLSAGGTSHALLLEHRM